MTTEKVSDLLRAADRISKSAIATCDADYYTTVKTSKRKSAQTAGQLIAAAVAGEVANQSSILASIKSVRAKHADQMKAANSLLDDAAKRAWALRGAALYLKGEANSIPVNLPDYVKNALAQIRSVRKVTAGACPTLPATLERAADDAAREVNHMKSVVARREAALGIATQKNRVKLAEQAVKEGNASMRVYLNRSKMALSAAEARYDGMKKRGLI